VISDDNCETVIAEYIRTKGVTRCPTACVVPTQASVTEADRAALEEYRSERDRQRREKAAARTRIILGGGQFRRVITGVAQPLHSSHFIRAGSVAPHRAEGVVDSCTIGR
jgi:hypothetical protein